MRLRTQVWSTQLGRYIEDDLELCDCLPVAVREGLSDRSKRLCEGAAAPTLWDEAESA